MIDLFYNSNFIRLYIFLHSLCVLLLLFAPHSLARTHHESHHYNNPYACVEQIFIEGVYPRQLTHPSQGQG